MLCIGLMCLDIVVMWVLGVLCVAVQFMSCVDVVMLIVCMMMSCMHRVMYML